MDKFIQISAAVLVGAGLALAGGPPALGGIQVYLDSLPMSGVQVEQGVTLAPVRTLAQATGACLLYTSPSPRDATLSRMPSSA